MPKLYGSDVRQPGKVTDLSSGVKEAGKVMRIMLFRHFVLKKTSDHRVYFTDITTGLLVSYVSPGKVRRREDSQEL